VAAGGCVREMEWRRKLRTRSAVVVEKTDSWTAWIVENDSEWVIIYWQDGSANGARCYWPEDIHNGIGLVASVCIWNAFNFWNVRAYFNVRYFGVRFVREKTDGRDGTPGPRVTGHRVITDLGRVGSVCQTRCLTRFRIFIVASLLRSVTIISAVPVTALLVYLFQLVPVNLLTYVLTVFGLSFLTGAHCRI